MITSEAVEAEQALTADADVTDFRTAVSVVADPTFTNRQRKVAVFFLQRRCQTNWLDFGSLEQLFENV